MAHQEDFARHASQVLRTHGLEGWKFSYDRASRRFGQCSHQGKSITMSADLTQVNTWEVCMNILLHEVAHALVGPGHGHDAVWQAKALEVGSDGKRYYDAQAVTAVAKVKATCPHCKHSFTARRRSQGGCARCYRGGKGFHPLLWTQVEQAVVHDTPQEVKGAYCPTCFLQLTTTGACGNC